VVMHYHLTNRRDSQYWRDIQDMEIPATLKHRIDLFRETGKVFRQAEELFAENSWVQVMMGQGVMPKQYHPTADVMSEPDLKRFLDDIRRNVDSTVKALPQHQAYIDQYCPGPREPAPVSAG
jgi:tryptophan 7-halogenase